MVDQIFPPTLCTGDDISSPDVIYQFSAPPDLWIRDAIFGFFEELTSTTDWTQCGDVTIDQAAEVFSSILASLDTVTPLTAFPLVIVEERQAQGTHGGTFTSGAWRTRSLNTEVLDTDNIASVSANRISLPAGTYRVNAVAGGFGVLYHRTRLYNVTGSAAILYGVNAFSPVWARSFDTLAVNTSNAILVGQFTLASASDIELQHYAQNTGTTYGFGVAGNINHECYASIRLEKIA